ncbi:hypothetical protein BASA60_001356 [Batrachochytrium salamandrivorans]|nr:hypothetical protein BASA60_001356 [Batrachochytrium salamandrivorans]
MRLAEAGDGHSLDPTHWETMPQPPQHIPPSSTLSMDLPFSLRELDHALGSMHPRKAPGDDGITTALMQAIAYDPKDHGTGDVNLDRPGALALLRVANTIFSSGAIPKVWRRDSVVCWSPIMCWYLSKGGFRTREESTAQVCALMDILRRRQISDLNSHIAFIDISKAFDTVPIHALLFKLRCIGIPTITMNFLSSLYSTSNARIRSGSLLSDPFPVQRGVRQGCPLSGLLFNVFINDKKKNHSYNHQLSPHTPIRKTRDATLASNLRGISLINVGLKILCKMVQARLSSLLESNNVLVPEQGGFRTHEESTAQVCALMDILRRRQIADLNSHIAFIDISKAFDTVPIHALLFKLRCIGIPAITMTFLSALYSTSNARIRSGSLLSDPFPVQRGVRQGCPLSGLLFNVFINDVLDGVAPISVPGLSQEHHPRGLMFADDIAIIAPSHESLLWYNACGPHTGTTVKATILPVEQSIGDSSSKNSRSNPYYPQQSSIFPNISHQVLSLSIQIYPVLQVITHPHPYPPAAVLYPSTPRPQPALFPTPATPTQTQLTHPIQLHGINLPSVSQYEYLGVIIDDLLNLSPWLVKKKRAITAAVHSISPLLRNNFLSTRSSIHPVQHPQRHPQRQQRQQQLQLPLIIDPRSTLSTTAIRCQQTKYALECLSGIVASLNWPYNTLHLCIFGKNLQAPTLPAAQAIEASLDSLCLVE